MSTIDRIVSSLREDGLRVTVAKSVRFSLLTLRNWQRARWLRQFRNGQPAEVVFTEIYRKNYWGNTESVSGYGSTLSNTADMQNDLISLVHDFSIASIYDAPCGDFNWMRQVVRSTSVQYHGVDIVPDVIAINRQRYERENCHFSVGNITRDTFPEADLWICRDCLIHLNYADIHLALRNFVASGIPYVLTTTYVNDGLFRNKDIFTGDFRMIDLFAEPFCLAREVAFRIRDTPVNDHTREMCLWTREQIAAALPAMENRLAIASRR